jgi:hypothetical protein
MISVSSVRSRSKMSVSCVSNYSHPQKHKIISKLWKFAKRNAEHKCKENIDKECALAWDTVNDYETSLRKLEATFIKKDPLDRFCDLEPDADECRTYDN